ncbi:MAG TPA: glycosyltransferase family A protein [Chitinophagaceae bacterium]|nr:glycosyltransferase family A protein [Chitinophagaceae bacterium]
MIFYSVIIPVYNRSHLLAETIDTVLVQTYPNFEIIIVDDGSSEDIKAVLDDKYNNESKVKYFHKQNEERGAARNFGLKQAKGDYAVFFDSDDLMKPQYLETLNKIIIEHPGVKLLATKFNYINKGKTEINSALQNLKEGWYDQTLFLKGNILACNYCIKIKDNDFKFFPPERELASMEDWLFLLANLAGNGIFIKNEICVTMRQHDERSMNNNQKVIVARRKATDWALKTLELPSSKKKILIAWSHYFCGIHEYLDFKRGAAVKEAISAIKGDGLQKIFLLLLVKSIVGRKFVNRVK